MSKLENIIKQSSTKSLMITKKLVDEEINRRLMTKMANLSLVSSECVFECVFDYDHEDPKGNPVLPPKRTPQQEQTLRKMLDLHLDCLQKVESEWKHEWDSDSPGWSKKLSDQYVYEFLMNRIEVAIDNQKYISLS